MKFATFSSFLLGMVCVSAWADGSSAALRLLAKPSAFQSNEVVLPESAGTLNFDAVGGQIELRDTRTSGKIGGLRIEKGKLIASQMEIHFKYQSGSLKKRIVIDIPFVGRKESEESAPLPGDVSVSVRNTEPIEVPLSSQIDLILSQDRSKSENGTRLELSPASLEALRNAIRNSIANGKWEVAVQGKPLKDILGDGIASSLQSLVIGSLADPVAKVAAERSLSAPIDYSKWMAWLDESSTGRIELTLAIADDLISIFPKGASALSEKLQGRALENLNAASTGMVLLVDRSYLEKALRVGTGNSNCEIHPWVMFGEDRKVKQQFLDLVTESEGTPLRARLEILPSAELRLVSLASEAGEVKDAGKLTQWKDYLKTMVLQTFIEQKLGEFNSGRGLRDLRLTGNAGGYVEGQYSFRAETLIVALGAGAK